METNYNCCTHYQTDEYDNGYVMFSVLGRKGPHHQEGEGFE